MCQWQMYFGVQVDINIVYWKRISSGYMLVIDMFYVFCIYFITIIAYFNVNEFIRNCGERNSCTCVVLDDILHLHVKHHSLLFETCFQANACVLAFQENVINDVKIR